MDKLSRNLSGEWYEIYSCVQNGVGKFNVWDVRGFYDVKFDDPWNFNLSENAVSVITACLTSFSLILFNDIVTRLLVRARHGQVVNQQMISRRRVLDSFSNPVNLLSACIARVRKSPSDSPDHVCSRERTGSQGLSKKTYGFLIVMSVLIVFAEFLFIFLATNQNNVYHVRLDTVPTFEFEDRGCEFLDSPAQTNSCYQMPLTEKPGFDLRASLQICTSNTVYKPEAAAAPSDENHYFLFLLVANVDTVQVAVVGKNQTTLENTRISVGFEQGGLSYVGMKNVTAAQMLSALLHRMERTNVTILSNSSDTSESIVSANVVVDASGVDLRKSHISSYYPVELIPENTVALTHAYFHNVLRSIMSPTQEGRGVVTLPGELQYLDQDPTPVAYYNRPWVSVVFILIVCCALLLIWTVLAVLGVESGVDSHLAGANFVKNVETTGDDVD